MSKSLDQVTSRPSLKEERKERGRGQRQGDFKQWELAGNITTSLPSAFMSDFLCRSAGGMACGTISFSQTERQNRAETL